jgi:Rab GDP dissociation inhibitor
MVSGVHCVCKKGYYIAIISAMMETANPEKELEPAFNIMGPILEKFFTVITYYIYSKGIIIKFY